MGWKERCFPVHIVHKHLPQRSGRVNNSRITLKPFRKAPGMLRAGRGNRHKHDLLCKRRQFGKQGPGVFVGKRPEHEAATTIAERTAPRLGKRPRGVEIVRPIEDEIPPPMAQPLESPRPIHGAQAGGDVGGGGSKTGRP